MKIKQLKLKNAKIYFHENQIHLTNNHEIYLSFTFSKRETTCMRNESANDHMQRKRLSKEDLEPVVNI